MPALPHVHTRSCVQHPLGSTYQRAALPEHQGSSRGSPAARAGEENPTHLPSRGCTASGKGDRWGTYIAGRPSFKRKISLDTWKHFVSNCQGKYWHLSLVLVPSYILACSCWGTFWLGERRKRKQVGHKAPCCLLFCPPLGCCLSPYSAAIHVGGGRNDCSSKAWQCTTEKLETITCILGHGDQQLCREPGIIARAR